MAGWYPDPGGGQGLYRYWDGQVWSAATTTDPASAAPLQGLVSPAPAGATSAPTGAHGTSTQGIGTQGTGTQGTSAYGTSAYGQGTGRRPAQPPQPYAQLRTRRRSGLGWWVGAGALLLVLVVVGVFAIRTATGGGLRGSASGQDTANVCPSGPVVSAPPTTPPADGRVHGGPVSYPQLGSPWGAPEGEDRVPFGVDVLSQEVTVQSDYDQQGKGHNWIASVLVGELQAGDGFFTPEQGSQIVVRCILGRFYGNNPVDSDVKVNKATTVDGHDAWLVESQLSFDIPGLQTKGERLIVAIVQAGTDRSGLFYASIPDTTPQLLQPARDALAELTVDG